MIKTKTKILNRFTDCAKGQCQLNKIANTINHDVFKDILNHAKSNLLDLNKQFPHIHKGCLQKIYAETLIETGQYLLGELIDNHLKTISKEKLNEH